ncbi:pentatricopeptide repeat protein [Grosmannia clavigera kw1407]|uniref:Pentatricopeptide repeat protein n=1 Tax=Grosmannia clavigera (strain kw1407 / UAMH 11150) TaxID=655863 RepID=F0XSY7_GROCL|nr:pentatricopeptide repeat protein [Grosmannia clavigera kw1407]EFW99388.1 pentatricopeptide repeat protein [Grosmannia clavigera kw1407]
MPTIYSSLYQTFIRQGFAKSFTHGYAQSVVAATHPHVLSQQNRPSFARRNSNRFGRIQALQLQSAFHTTSGAPEHRPALSHGGLDAYYEHLQSQISDEAENEWVQFQFQRRIEWKPSPASVLTGSEEKLNSIAETENEGASEVLLAAPPAVPTVDATAEASGRAAVQETAAVNEVVVEDGDTAESEAADQAALAQIDAALEKEIAARKQRCALEEGHTQTSATAVEEQNVLSASPAARTATPATDRQSRTYADHLTSLSEAGRYAEIPAVFEAMLVAGIRPIATAYNALLMAAIHLPIGRMEVISKALDVYADMMRRKIAPDSDTFDILIGLLASRSLELSVKLRSLEEKRMRYGGMDEPGKFMFASHELENAIASEEDRLDYAIKLFEASVAVQKASYSSETYHQLISACAQAGRLSDMLQLFGHMETNKVTPFAATFPAMIHAFASSGDLISAVECYDEYRNLAISNDAGENSLLDRLDAQVYAAVINAYIVCDKLPGAMKFYQKIIDEYGPRTTGMKDVLVSAGFVQGFANRGIYPTALEWAQGVEQSVRVQALSEVAVLAADHGEQATAIAAFAALVEIAGAEHAAIASPTTALLALHIRLGDVAGAAKFWQMLRNPLLEVSASLIEPTAMYAVALIGSGQVAKGLMESDTMFERIRQSREGQVKVSITDEIEEGVAFISRYMQARNIVDPREDAASTYGASPFSSTPTVSSFEDHSNFDPYAHNTDFKGSSLISDDLEGSHGRKGPKLNEALARFRNMRRAGRHPRYITYAKLISAASREGKMDLCNNILAMARTDVPLLPQYAVVRYGWSSILDAMVGTSLSVGNRSLAEQYHQELLSFGSAPSANTFGLYITTLKESTKTFDEASEAVKIFHRAKAEGVEPSSFLYNALIGKLGKARRIDDCLFYFAEMRALAIKPTSVTYGTIVNALCRVSDDKFAEELFDEMEAMPNYKARPAPYNSMMQFFLTTKRDKAKVLAYYERMLARSITPTSHTHKLLIDTHATLEPIDMAAAEAVLERIRASGQKPEPVHYASLIHARGCNMHDMEGARRIFDSVMDGSAVTANASLFQALFEAMVANHQVAETEPVLAIMRKRGVELTPYIANTLIHGWAAENDIAKAAEIYAAVGRNRREPSTYEAMTRAYLATEEREKAQAVVSEMLHRGYPSAVVNKVLELLGGGHATEAASVTVAE